MSRPVHPNRRFSWDQQATRQPEHVLGHTGMPAGNAHPALTADGLAVSFRNEGSASGRRFATATDRFRLTLLF